MNGLQRVPAVFFFEWRRALTVPRLAWMLALMAFPPMILGLIRFSARTSPPFEIATVLVYALSPCVACMMGVFLWATPAISSELEGRSWVYLAIRPHGPIAVLLGKYLVAVSWSLPVGIVSAILGTLALQSDHVVSTMIVQCALVVLSCIAYSAVFLLIGVIAPKRAMVVGILYGVACEVGFSMIPAAINLATIQYRLRCLLVRWSDMDISMVDRNPVFLAYFGDESSAWHLSVLLLMTLGYLVAAGVLLRYREFTSAAETDS